MISKFTILFCFLFGILVKPCFSQKIKYKDLFVLLNLKQYEQAEPFLWKYLEGETNNPNAYLFMGFIQEDKFFRTYKTDPKNGEIKKSAIKFLNQAFEKIDNIEIKENSVYYGMYSRRNLKTGKFEIQLLDIQADIKRRVEQLSKLGSPDLPEPVSEVISATKTAVYEPPPQVSTSIKPTGDYFALIIGVSEYDQSRLNLDKPAADAKKLQEILVNNYEFKASNVNLLLNPTRQQIFSELFKLRRTVMGNDNLLIFYAGHGYWDEQASQGYWWPKDASSEDPSFWLSNSDLREQIRGIKSAHTLLISDACFSGGIFKTRSANIKSASLDMQLLYKMPSRRAITSGTMTTVPDKSVFFEFLSKRLLENKSPFLSSQQLFDSFRLAVVNNSLIVPQEGVIAESGDEGGDFIFIHKN